MFNTKTMLFSAVWFASLTSLIYGITEINDAALRARVQNITFYEGVNTSVTRYDIEECEDQNKMKVTINTNTIIIEKLGEGSAHVLNCTDKDNSTISINIIRRSTPFKTNDSNAEVRFVNKSSNRNTSDSLMMQCWNGRGWEERNGTIINETLCCSEFAEGCQKLVEYGVVMKEGKAGDNITVSYGFTLSYNITMSHHKDMKLSFFCGNETMCTTGGGSGGDVCNIQWNDTINDMMERIAIITIPRLTSQLQDENHCVFNISFGTLTLASSTIDIYINESSPIVSNNSDVGLYNIKSKGSPNCWGDGWPPPEAKWDPSYIKKEARKRIADQNDRGKYYCTVTKKKGNVTVKRAMVPIAAPVEPDISMHETTQLMFPNETRIARCQLKDLSRWSPKPTIFGWVDTDGQEFTAKPEGDETYTWSMNISKTGNYYCFARVVKKVEGDILSYTLYDIHKVKKSAFYDDLSGTNTNNTNTAAARRTNNISIETVSDAESPKKPTFTLSYPYILALVIITVVIVVVAAVGYKILRSNLRKVNTLDTKISLQTIKSKMGFNALYSQYRSTDSMMTKVTHVLRDDLITDCVIGTGQFGKVLKGTLITRDDEGLEIQRDVVAIKSLNSINENDNWAEFFKEVLTMYKFDHPNVLKLLGVCTDSNQLLILSEFMSCGNLKDYLMIQTMLSDYEKLDICYQVASGLEHISSRDVVHRDVAARNCLVGPDLVVKVGDFGLSRSVAMNEYYKQTGGQVPIRWMSPESIKYGRYTHESDVWAFGVLMWEVYTGGSFPYGGKSNDDVQIMVDAGYRLPIPSCCNSEIGAVIRSTWEREPGARPSFCTLKNQLHEMQALTDRININLLYSTPLNPDMPPSTTTSLTQDSPAALLTIAPANRYIAGDRSVELERETPL